MYLRGVVYGDGKTERERGTSRADMIRTVEFREETGVQMSLAERLVRNIPQWA